MSPQSFPPAEFKPQDKRAAQRADFGEIGVSGIRRFAGIVQEEFLTNLQGLRGVKVYREMGDNDSIVGACLYAIEQVIKKASWSVEPSGDDAIHLEAASFIKSCTNDMSHSWLDFISEALTCLQYGWAWHEIVYKVRKGQTSDLTTNSKHNDGLIGWAKLPLRLQSSWYEWKFDDYGGVQAFVQCAPPDYKILTIPYEKSILFRAKNIGNNPEGRSILRSAYRAWYFKKSIEELEAIGVERDLVGLPVFQPPEGFDVNSTENAAVKAQVRKLIANLRRDEQEGILLPPGWTLSLLTNGVSRRQFDVDRIINRYDKRIAATVLAQFIMLGMDRIGSFALSKNQNDLFLSACQSLLDNICDTLNMFAVPRLIALNPKFSQLINEGKYPRFVTGKIAELALTDIATYVSMLGKSGFLVPDVDLEKELKRIGGFSEISDRRVEVVGDDDDDGNLDADGNEIDLAERQMQLLGGKNPFGQGQSSSNLLESPGSSGNPPQVGPGKKNKKAPQSSQE